MADFGLTEDMYGTNYYRRSESESEEGVPIRWMAPESIETNIYNEETDVVSLLVNHSRKDSDIPRNFMNTNFYSIIIIYYKGKSH